MKLGLFDVIINAQQNAKNQSATYKEPQPVRVKELEQETKYADERERTVGTKERRLPFALQADAALRQADQQRKERYQYKID